MIQRDQLIRDIGELISDLSAPLSNSEISHGWTEQSQKSILKFFIGVEKKLLAGEFPDKNELRGIARGIDHWGVEGGGLFEKACALSNHILEL